PYTTAMHDPVAPEMFVGRSQEVKKILRDGSNLLVYGGRQVGKTALMNAFLREVKSDPTYLTDDPIYHATGDPLGVWPQLASLLQKRGIAVAFSTEAGDPAQV